MADLKKRLSGNVAGNFFVDSSCIDCDQCRQIAPGIFRETDGASIVYRQPEADEETLRAWMALVTCPTSSIGTAEKQGMARAVAAFPEKVADNIYFCGFAAESSFGTSSYLIVRPEGNVLVDSPRFARLLVNRIEDMGGVKLMFLTHRDDVADHEQFRKHFGCERILHEADAFCPVERPITGTDPVRLADDLLVIPTPGHTEGHAVLLYRDTFLFTGDHLWGRSVPGELGASRSVCWYSWPEQRRSMERLLDFKFEWVLPGHGARQNASAAEMHKRLGHLIERMG